MTESEEPIEVVIHPALIEPFKEWLGSRGLMLARMPEMFQRKDDLELFMAMATPTEETMRKWGLRT